LEVGESKKAERRKWRPAARRYNVEMAATLVSLPIIPDSIREKGRP